MLNLTQPFEDGFEKRLVTGGVFVYLSAACDTVNHRILMTKIYQMTDDKAMTTLLDTLLKNRMFYVALNQKKSRWRQQRNGLPQDSVLAPLLYNISKPMINPRTKKHLVLFMQTICALHPKKVPLKLLNEI